MKVYQCTNTECNYPIERPTQPFKCPNCGRQGLGQFKVVSGVQPASASPPAAPPLPPSPPPAPASPVPVIQTAPPEHRRPEKSSQPVSPARSVRPVIASPPSTPKPEKPPASPVVPRPRGFVWSFPEHALPEEKASPLCNAPAVDANGRIYLHIHDRLVALEERNGCPVVLWEYVTGGRAPGPVVLGQDGNLRLHCSDGCLHCVNPAGKQVWPPVPVGQPLGYAAPVVDDQGNTFLSVFDGGLIRVDPDGRVPKSGRYFRSRQKFNSGGVIRGGVLYIGAEDGHLFAVQLGDEKGAGLWNHVAGQGRTGWYIHCRPAITEDGVIVVAGRDECLYGFAPDGSSLWKTPMSGQMLGSPVLDRNGHIYVGIGQWQRGRQPQGLLVCSDGNSHKVRWEYRAAGPVESTPVVGDDMIYFGDNAGLIHAVDFSGRAAWTAQLDAPVRSTGTIFAPHRLAFGLDNETLVVLDCSASGWAK